MKRILWLSAFTKKKGSAKNKCSHADTASIIASLDRIPTTNGGHTSFILMSCGQCEKVFGFPQANLLLTTQEARQEIQTALTEKGWGELDTKPLC